MVYNLDYSSIKYGALSKYVVIEMFSHLSSQMRAMCFVNLKDKTTHEKLNFETKDFLKSNKL